MNYQIVHEDLHIHGGVVEQVVCQGDVIMHGGCVNTMTVQGDCIQHGGIINRRVQQSGSNATYQQTEPKVRVIYKDRVEYRDRGVYRDRVVYRERPAGKQTGTVTIKEEELRTLRGQAKYWLQKSEELEGENTRLKQELEDTERQKLLREIEDLKDKLKTARQRENVAVQQRKDAEKQARQTIANVWDQYRPTKDACKQLYENLKAFLDCETE